MAVKRHTKGKVLIVLGLLAGVGAVALLVAGRRQAADSGVASSELPEIERRDAEAAERAISASIGTRSASDDAVGDAEQRLDNVLAGKPSLPDQPSGQRRGRHAAKE